MTNRKCLPPGRHWEDRPHVFGGKDLEAGGTWLGINNEGVVAAIMNRVDTLGPMEDKRSRGELVLEALDHSDSSESLNAIIEIEKDSYRGFNMFIGDNLNAYWIKSDENSSFIEYFNVPDGLSMITAYDRNDISSDRIKNYLSKFSLATIPQPSKEEWQDWETLLGSTYSNNNEPLSAMCIKTDIGFQTVSSSLIAVPGFQPSHASKKPIFRYANGSPDLHAYEELEI